MQKISFSVIAVLAIQGCASFQKQDAVETLEIGGEYYQATNQTLSLSNESRNRVLDSFGQVNLRTSNDRIIPLTTDEFYALEGVDGLIEYAYDTDYSSEPSVVLFKKGTVQQNLMEISAAKGWYMPILMPEYNMEILDPIASKAETLEDAINEVISVMGLVAIVDFESNIIIVEPVN